MLEQYYFYEAKRTNLSVSSISSETKLVALKGNAVDVKYKKPLKFIKTLTFRQAC